MGTKRQTKEASADNTYLLCPLSDDKVEAIRANAYESREKTLAQERAQERKVTKPRKLQLKELKRLKERKILRPDSGETDNDDMEKLMALSEAYHNPLLYTQFARRELYFKLNRKQMQGVLAQYYGWEKWSEDPWGSFPKFCEWLNNARDNEMAVWAVNETSLGRAYLALGIVEGLVQLDFSQMMEKDLVTQIGYGAACFLYVKNYTNWDDFKPHYPKEPLPVRLVNEWVSKVYPFDRKFSIPKMTFPCPLKSEGGFDIPERTPDPEEIIDIPSMFIDAHNYGPLTRYRFLISGIYLWSFVLHEYSRRAKGHSELVSLMGYKATSNPVMASLTQKLGHKDYPLRDKQEWWEEIGRVTKWFQKDLAEKYSDESLVFSDSIDGDVWEKKYYPNTEQALLSAVGYWLKQPADQLIKVGLTGTLVFNLKKITESNIINTLKEEDQRFAEGGKAWGKAQRKIKPANEVEKWELKDKIGLLQDKIVGKEPIKPSDKELAGLIEENLIAAKRPVSLDREKEDEDGDTYTLGDTIEDKRTRESPEQIEQQELLNAINERWSPRQRLVMNLEGKNDSDIALALEKKFGKPSSEGNVRQLRRSARKKAKEVRDEIDNN